MSKIKYSHSFTVQAVVCEDGSTGLCGITTKTLPTGVEIIGNGTLPHPLDVKLSGAYAAAPDLLEAAQKAAKYIAGTDSYNAGGRNATNAYNELFAAIAKATGN